MIAFSQREKILAISAALLALLLVVVVWWGNRPRASSPSIIVVHVEGAIRRPGVYRVKEGTRIYELIEEAGGTTEEADLRSLNLAAFLYDGQKLIIPATSSGTLLVTSPLPSSLARIPSSTAIVNVNTASVKELEVLPGIGEVLAQRIVEYRENNGPFKTPEDLLKVRGIGPKKLEEIRDLISF